MRIGPYTLIRELGRGGMAQVWLAHRVWEDGERRSCVIKFPRRNAVTDEGMLRQFLEEWRLAIRLRHNNIVSVFDAGAHEGLPYLVMDYVAGKDLAEIIRTLARLGKQFDVETAVHVIRELGQGLLYAHEFEYQDVPQRIVHRDVASKNAMVDGTGGVLLMDFGVATSLRTQTSRMHVKGTLAYMAPEHYLGQASAISDVYGLGAILWELLVGRPFRDGLAGEALLGAVVGGAVEPVERELPEVVRRVLDGMLEPAASKRMTLREVLVALQHFPSRRLHLQEMMVTYFGRAGKRTGLSQIHFAASKELADTLAVVKVAGVSLSEIRRRKLPGQPHEVPLDFVPVRKEDTARIDARAITTAIDDDLDEEPGAVAPAREEVEPPAAIDPPAAVDRSELELEDGAASAMTTRWRTPAGTVRAPRAPMHAVLAPAVAEPTPRGATVRMDLPAPAPVQAAAEAPVHPVGGDMDASGRVPGDTLRSPDSSDPQPAAQATVRLESALGLDVVPVGRTEFLPVPAAAPVEPSPPTFSPRVGEGPRTEPSPRRARPSSLVLAPVILIALGVVAWSSWPRVHRDPRGSEAEPTGSSVAVAAEAPIAVASTVEPSQVAGVDAAADLNEAPAGPQPRPAPVPVAQPGPMQPPPPGSEPDPAAVLVATDVPEPVPVLPPEPEPVQEPRPEPSKAAGGSPPKKEPRPPKPVPKLEVVVRRGLMVDHAEVRIGRGKVTTVPARGAATLYVAPGTHTLRYRTKPDGEWQEKRLTFSPDTAYSAFVELGGLRISTPTGGKGR